jgi:thioredoxin reductase (NADPH)
LSKRIAIVGAGPAGLAAAVSALCEGLQTYIIAPTFEGRMSASPRIENILGFPGGISGADFNANALDQVEKLGGIFVKGEASHIIDWPTQPIPFDIRLGDDGAVSASAVILATGMSPTAPTLPSAPAPGHDGYHVVAGGGDAAVQVALWAAEQGVKTVLAVRGGSLDRCTEYLKTRALAAPGLTIRYKTVALDKGNGNIAIGPTGTAPKLILRNSILQTLLGAEPKTSWAEVATDPRGFVTTDTNFQTSRPGVFAAGDCRANSIKRINVAAGEGAAVGHIVANWLKEQK